MYFKNYTPKSNHQKFVDSYFSVDMNEVAEQVNDLIVPDGTFGLLFIENSGDMFRSNDVHSSNLPITKSCLFGQKTKAINYSYSKGSSQAFGLKIKPLGMSFFTKLGSELKDCYIELNLSENLLLKELENKVLDSDNVFNKIVLIENYIDSLLNSDCINNNDFLLFEAVLNFIFQNKGDLRFNEISNHFNINYKKLERLFNKFLGINPKTYIRIIRFNSVINQYKSAEVSNLTQLGLQNGFFDQSHFIREFKQFTSLTPKQFFEKDKSFSEKAFLNIINNRWKAINE